MTSNDEIDYFESQIDYLEDKVENLEAELSKARGLLWFAYTELKGIKARDGAPPGVHETYFAELVETIARFLGPEERKPWPSEPAKEVEFVNLRGEYD